MLSAVLHYLGESYATQFSKCPTIKTLNEHAEYKECLHLYLSTLHQLLMQLVYCIMRIRFLDLRILQLLGLGAIHEYVKLSNACCIPVRSMQLVYGAQYMDRGCELPFTSFVMIVLHTSYKHSMFNFFSIMSSVILATIVD